MKNPIREALAAGHPSIGSWLNLASPLSAEVMAAAGFPWLVVDTEHSPFDMELVAHTFRAIEARGAIPLARSWDQDPVTIGRLLDAGAWGLVFPHVSNVEQAESLARAMRYPPEGTRSMGTGRCTTISPDYRRDINTEVLCIPQIEDMEGIDKAEAIASVPGVDIGFLGPNDLALSMGVETGPCRSRGRPAALPGGLQARRQAQRHPRRRCGDRQAAGRRGIPVHRLGQRL